MLESAYQFVHDWMKMSNLTLDAEKRGLIHFHTRPKYGANLSVTLPNVDGMYTVHEPKKVVRWLGIFFDRKLRFHEHTNIMKERSLTATNACRILGNSVRGMKTEVV